MLVSDIVHFYKKSSAVDINKLVMGIHKESETNPYYEGDISNKWNISWIYHLIGLNFNRNEY